MKLPWRDRYKDPPPLGVRVLGYTPVTDPDDEEQFNILTRYIGRSGESYMEDAECQTGDRCTHWMELVGPDKES